MQFGVFCLRYYRLSVKILENSEKLKEDNKNDCHHITKIWIYVYIISVWYMHVYIYKIYKIRIIICIVLCPPFHVLIFSRTISYDKNSI